MATNKDPIFLNTVLTPAVQFVDADGTTRKIVITAGGDGGAVTQLTATSTDSSAVVMQISINDSVNTNPIGEVNVPANSGTDSTLLPAINLLDPTLITLIQNDGSVLLGPGASLEIAPKTTITGATTMFITAIGGSFTA